MHRVISIQQIKSESSAQLLACPGICPVDRANLWRIFQALVSLMLDQSNRPTIFLQQIFDHLASPLQSVPPCPQLRPILISLLPALLVPSCFPLHDLSVTVLPARPQMAAIPVAASYR